MPDRNTTERMVRADLNQAFASGPITRETIGTIADTHSVDVSLVYDEMATLGYDRNDGSQARTEPRTDPEARRGIVEGSIFKSIVSTSEEVSDDTPVVTTMGELRKERAAVVGWIQDARDNMA